MRRDIPSIFDGCSEEILDEALKYFKELEVDIGAELIQEGEQDATLICVLTGQLEIKTGGVTLGSAGPGDIVGEMALFGGGVRTASVEANDNCQLLLLDPIGFEALRYLGNPVAQAIEERALELLSERLRKVNHEIASLAEGTLAEHTVPSASFFENVVSMFGGGGGRLATPSLDVAVELVKSSLFSDLPQAGVTELAEFFEPLRFKTGHFLCTEGEPGSQMYVVAEGLVDVVVDTGEGRIEHLATLEAGEAFGVGSLIEPGQPRMASCICRNKVTVLELDQLTWAGLVHRTDMGGSCLRYAVIRSLIDQLAYANGQLTLLDYQEQASKTQEIRALGPLLRAGAGVEATGTAKDEDLPDYLRDTAG